MIVIKYLILPYCSLIIFTVCYNCGAIVKVRNANILVSVFDLQMHNCVFFQIIVFDDI